MSGCSSVPTLTKQTHTQRRMSHSPGLLGRTNGKSGSERGESARLVAEPWLGLACTELQKETNKKEEKDEGGRERERECVCVCVRAQCCKTAGQTSGANGSR